MHVIGSLCTGGMGGQGPCCTTGSYVWYRCFLSNLSDKLLFIKEWRQKYAYVGFSTLTYDASRSCQPVFSFFFEGKICLHSQWKFSTRCPFQIELRQFLSKNKSRPTGSSSVLSVLYQLFVENISISRATRLMPSSRFILGSQ